MKIESVNVTVFQYPTRRVSDSAGHSHPGVESMAKMAMLTITADDGAQGFSFAPPEVVRPFVVNTFFRKVLVGQDPFNRERIWQDLNHWQRGSAHQLTERALSFVEQALWDLIGRSLKMPVYKLLGGYRDTVPAYGSTMCGDDLPGGLSTPEEYAAFAEKLVARGYKAIKLHTWMPPISFAPNPKMDIKACAAVREAVGPDIDLMIDGYHWYSRAEALWIGKELEKLNFAWFEEPMEEDSMSSYAWLAENLSIPIVGPESFGGKHHMRAEWVKAGACDILRAGANGVGGITPTMKVAALAESFGMDSTATERQAWRWWARSATAAGTSAACCIRSSTTMNRRPISTALSTRWMTRDLCICHNVRVSVKTLILRISKPIPLAKTDLKK